MFNQLRSAFATKRYWWKERARVRKLSSEFYQKMFDEIDVVTRGVTDSAERIRLEIETHKRWEQLEKQLAYIRQHELNVRMKANGIRVPLDFCDSSVDYFLLTLEGEFWARRELQRIHDERIEFWARLALPILSIIVSIVAVYIAAHK